MSEAKKTKRRSQIKVPFKKGLSDLGSLSKDDGQALLDVSKVNFGFETRKKCMILIDFPSWTYHKSISYFIFFF